MRQTLVAVFHSQAHAHQAQNALVRGGFARETMLPVSGGIDIDGVASTGGSPQHDEPFGRKIGGLFGLAARDKTNVYAIMARRGKFMLTVEVPSSSEAKRAEDIMEYYEPVDIRERVPAAPEPPAETTTSQYARDRHAHNR